VGDWSSRSRRNPTDGWPWEIHDDPNNGVRWGAGFDHWYVDLSVMPRTQASLPGPDEVWRHKSTGAVVKVQSLDGVRVRWANMENFLADKDTLKSFMERFERARNA
jgi:hypothetical protein